MGQKTLTRLDIAEAIYEEVGLSRNECAQLLESTLNHICDALVRGENVKLSSFASFNVIKKNARIGRNPKTGAPATIPPLRVVSFRPSFKLKQRVMRGNKAR